MNRSSTLLLRCRESQHNSRYLGSRRPRPACEVSEEAAVQRWLKNNHPLVRRLEVRWFSFFRSLLHIGYGATKPMMLAHKQYSDDPCSAAVEAVLEKWWDLMKITMAATDPDLPSHRHYHSLLHVDRMCCLVDQFEPDLDRADIVELAVWFNDCVYDPTAAPETNEEGSAVQLEQFAADVLTALEQDGHGLHSDHVLGSEGIAVATRWIRDPLSSTRCLDLDYFKDFQMSPYGLDATDYEQYARWIRIEYQHIPIRIYRERRLGTLEQLLELEAPHTSSPAASPAASPVYESDNKDKGKLRATAPAPVVEQQLFIVPKLKDMWESKARENIAWEFDEVLKGSFPLDPMSCE